MELLLKKRSFKPKSGKCYLNLQRRTAQMHVGTCEGPPSGRDRLGDPWEPAVSKGSHGAGSAQLCWPGFSSLATGSASSHTSFCKESRARSLPPCDCCSGKHFRALPNSWDSSQRRFLSVKALNFPGQRWLSFICWAVLECTEWMKL